ncbi:MAG TPA: hypothetical protein VGE60_12915 [Telluria sp.]
MLKQTSLIAVAIAGLLAASAPSLAQDYSQTGPQATPVPRGQVTVRPREMRRFYMPRADVAEVRGEYLMEDGRTASIINKNRKLVVDFDNRITELEAVGAYVFENERDDMTLVYTKDRLGDDIIVISYIPQQAVAGGPQGRVRLSSR